MRALELAAAAVVYALPALGQWLATRTGYGPVPQNKQQGEWWR